VIHDDAPVLLIEDEPQIRRFVRAALEEDGYRVTEAATAADGLARAAREHPALVLLDLGLPDRDGAELVRELRLWSQVPIVILSARSAEPEKIAALDAGADDYLTKPFGLGELLARVRAAARRATRSPTDSSPLVEFGDVCVDHLRHVVERNGRTIHLTPIEYRLLALLIASEGRVLTHRQILREVWGPGHVESNPYLRVYVGNLRRKLEDDPARPRHILTETGVGYRFVR
jgi:two-component system, OmpR family, KDP operon response regulator KdpE